MAFGSRVVGPLAVVAFVLSAQSAAAQVAPTMASPVRVWVLSGSTGLSLASGDAGLALGAAVAWGFAPRWEIEIGGQWLDRPSGQEALAFGATTQFRLRGSGRAVPYVRAGMAAYTVTLDATTPDVPGFYRARMIAARQSLFRARHSFTDPAIVLGGGVDLQLSRNVHLRPAVEVMTVLHDRRTLVASVMSLQLAYHFENPRITPARR